MSKPASLPSWATDTNFSSGPKSGSATKIEPSAGAKGQGEVPGQPYRAERHNWWMNLVYQWASYLNGITSDTDFTGANFAWTGNHSIPAANLSYSSPLSISYVAPLLTGAPRTNTDGFTNTANIVSLFTPGATWQVPVYLPNGSTVTQLDATFTQGLAHGTTPATVSLVRIATDWGAPYGANRTVMASVTATGAGTFYLSDSTITSAVIDNSLYSYFIELGASDTANPDTFAGARVLATVPKPTVW